jgi:hypothetical protein
VRLRDLYLLQLTHPCGVAMTAGPVPLLEAMSFVDTHVLPYGWQHRYRGVVPLDEAIAHLTAGAAKPEPAPGNDRMVALRRGIVCDPGLDGADDDRIRQLLAHVDAHRPLQMWTGPEECLLGECQHDERGTRRRCPEVVPAEQLCTVCSVIHDTGSEYGPEYLLRVTWPCTVITTACQRFGVTAATPATGPAPVAMELLRAALDTVAWQRNSGDGSVPAADIDALLEAALTILPLRDEAHGVTAAAPTDRL